MNYIKVNGDIFAQWMLTEYIGVLLFHAEEARGSRQNVFVEDALPTYINNEYYVEFLDSMLHQGRMSRIISSSNNKFGIFFWTGESIKIRKSMEYFLMSHTAESWTCGNLIWSENISQDKRLSQMWLWQIKVLRFSKLHVASCKLLHKTMKN